MAELSAQVESVAYSRLDDAGVEEVKRNRVLKLDLRSGSSTRQQVAVDADEFAVAIGDPSREELLLVFDGPSGRDTVASSTVMVSFADSSDHVQTLTYWQRAANLDDAFGQLRDGVREWGFNPDLVEGWIAAMSGSYRNTGDKVVLTMGVSPESGLVNEVQIDYEPGKSVSMRYMLYLDPTIYQPEVIDSIRLTGQAPREFLYSGTPR